MIFCHSCRVSFLRRSDSCKIKETLDLVRWTRVKIVKVVMIVRRIQHSGHSWASSEMFRVSRCVKPRLTLPPGPSLNIPQLSKVTFAVRNA